MKSITTKLRRFFAMLILALCCFTTSYAQTEVPTDAETQELLNNPDAMVLENYLQQQGYTDAGIIPESRFAINTTLDASAKKSSSLGAFETSRTVVVAKQFKNTDGSTIDVTYAGEITSSGYARSVIGENISSDFIVSGGIVQVVAKNLSNFINKLNDCWRRFVQGGGVTNCTNCYNCLKNAFSSGAWWQKLIKALRCAPPCFRCVVSIYQFYLCMRN